MKVFLLFSLLLTTCSPLEQTPTPTLSSIAPTPSPQITALNVPTLQHSNAAPIQHIFIIIFETKDQAEMLAYSYFGELAKRGAFLSRYYGITHPSQPNYIALIGGDTLGVSDNDNHNLPQSNLVDLLEAKNISWKTYQENYQGKCFAGGSAQALYARKHNPFISFDSIRTNPARCAKIVNAAELADDIAINRLPAFSLYTPNMNNSMHDQLISFGADWLKSFLEPKLRDPNFCANTLVIITMDESRNFFANVPLYTVLLGAMVRPGTTDSTRYNHYSLLRTVQETFHLGTLNRNDATAPPFSKCNFKGGCQ